MTDRASEKCLDRVSLILAKRDVSGHGKSESENLVCDVLYPQYASNIYHHSSIEHNDAVLEMELVAQAACS
jgi:hypothetical protein